MQCAPNRLQWDIFCAVIDNFGDIGVCWRLAAELATRGHRVRLWVDDASALAWMAPWGCSGVCVLHWTKPLAPADLRLAAEHPGDVLIEAFGCDIAPEFVALCAQQHCRSGLKPVWLNVEYLSAEASAQRNHGLASTISAAQGGPAVGWTKWFYYPGFTPKSGGLLREADLAQRQAAFDRRAWLGSHNITAHVGKTLVSVFCYEPAVLAALLRQLAQGGLAGQRTHLLVTNGRAQRAVHSALIALGLDALVDKPVNAPAGGDALGKAGDFNPNPNPSPSPSPSENINEKSTYGNPCGDCLLSISYLPKLTQADFDHLLWACDVNFVRGEDSLVRALWAGKALVWQIYPQDDGAHAAKLHAFLQQLDAPSSVRRFHAVWNGLTEQDLPNLSESMLKEWTHFAQHAARCLAGSPDLVSKLLDFVAERRRVVSSPSQSIT